MDELLWFLQKSTSRGSSTPAKYGFVCFLDTLSLTPFPFPVPLALPCPPPPPHPLSSPPPSLRLLTLLTAFCEIAPGPFLSNPHWPYRSTYLSGSCCINQEIVEPQQDNTSWVWGHIWGWTAIIEKILTQFFCSILLLFSFCTVLSV